MPLRAMKLAFCKIEAYLMLFLDRRIAVLLNQNPGMTADEARAQAEASPEYQDMVATNQQYEALTAD